MSSSSSAWSAFTLSSCSRSSRSSPSSPHSSPLPDPLQLLCVFCAGALSVVRGGGGSGRAVCCAFALSAALGSWVGLLLGSLLLCGAPLSRVASACESSHAHVQIARAETALNRVETSETRELSVCYLCAICVLSVCYLRIALSSDSQSYLDSYQNSYFSRECTPSAHSTRNDDARIVAQWV